MLNYLRKIIKPKYPTLNRIEINAARILANFDYLKSRQPEAAIWPVLKSNAYGHGLKEMAILLNQSGANMVAVDSFPEAQIVYRYFRGQVLLLGEMPVEAYRYLRFSRTEMVVYNQKTLRRLARLGKKARIHLFVNSGMNREGIQDLKSFINDNKKYLDKVTVNGLCSHLASSDQESDLNQRQLDKFLADLAILRAASYWPRWVHLGNSAAVFKINNPLLTAYRPGLALYGYNPIANSGSETAILQPALEVFSKIVSISDLSAGDSVSYNETYRASQNERIAVIPFGYFEGLDRRLSNRGIFSLTDKSGQSRQVKIAGRVCMNLTCLSVPQDTKVGTIVKLIAADPQAPNSVEALADIIGTIPYEVLARLQTNIRREIIYKK